MLRRVGLFLIFLTMVPAFGQSTSKYQVGTITEVKAHQAAGEPASDSTIYDVSVKVGTTIYVVTQHASTAASRKVMRYDNATATINGSTLTPNTSTAFTSFQLDAANTTATGLAADATHVWVTNSGTREVFVYNPAATTQAQLLLGKWTLDTANVDPTDITNDPSSTGSQPKLWVIDKTTKKIYEYGATAVSYTHLTLPTNREV